MILQNRHLTLQNIIQTYRIQSFLIKHIQHSYSHIQIETSNVAGPIFFFLHWPLLSRLWGCHQETKKKMTNTCIDSLICQNKMYL